MFYVFYYRCLKNVQQLLQDIVCAQAHVRVWRSDTLQTLYILGSGIVHKSVISLGFSKAKVCVHQWPCVGQRSQAV